jgi:hypothetical protein
MAASGKKRERVFFKVRIFLTLSPAPIEQKS